MPTRRSAWGIAALKLVLVPMHDEVVAADLRWIATALLLAVLAAVALVRPPRRAAA